MNRAFTLGPTVVAPGGCCSDAWLVPKRTARGFVVTSPFGRLLQGPKMVGVEVPLDLDPTKFVRSEAVTPAGMFQGHIWKPCIWGQDLFRTLNQIRQNCVTKEGTFGTTSCGVCHWPKKKQGLFGSLSQKNFRLRERNVSNLIFKKTTPVDFR